MKNGTYIAIDLKSFYASVECVARGLDPLRTNLVVADPTRTEKTICLAVSPPLKAYGIPGRARLFEVIEKVKIINDARAHNAIGGRLEGASVLSDELERYSSLALDYIVAPPRMSLYMQVSTQAYEIYLRYIAPEDIHVYSVDEVFINAAPYLKTYGMTARELARRMIDDVLRETGVTATAGIGTNMYLCKIAMDIEAKKMPADKDGVRIAELDEQSYRKKLWAHTPITDFWRIGGGYSRSLEAHGMYTMGDVALCSVYNEDLLYKLFGVNAELLIDHAWGWENCTIESIKSYRPQSRSLSCGQVLKEPYSHEKGAVIVREMAESLALDLVRKGVMTDGVVLDVGYDTNNLRDSALAVQYDGGIKIDRYGRKIPSPSHGSTRFEVYTSSARQITEAISALYERIADPSLFVRRFCVCASNVQSERKVSDKRLGEQIDMFTDYAARDREDARRRREKHMQQAMIKIRERYGKNAILRGMNFEDGATARERNAQIGGHRA